MIHRQPTLDDSTPCPVCGGRSCSTDGKTPCRRCKPLFDLHPARTGGPDTEGR